ncbi:MAG: MauE/DoxX family redox-associated membrane protein [Planctomycetota bacterium]
MPERDLPRGWGWKLIAGTCIRAVVGVLFLFAAIAKSVEPVAFSSVIESLLRLGSEHQLPGSPATERVLGIAVITWEALLGGLLLFGYRPRLGEILALVTLAVFCFVLIGLLVLPNTESCSCFGGLTIAATDARQTAIAGIVRNLALMGLLAWAAWPIRISSARAEISGDSLER